MLFRSGSRGFGSEPPFGLMTLDSEAGYRITSGPKPPRDKERPSPVAEDAESEI
jgi:hypothetical protein